MRSRYFSLLILMTVLSAGIIAGCGKKNSETSEATPTESFSITIFTSGNAETTPLPTVSLEPAITAPPTPEPTPKPSIGPYFEPTVTKSPLDEECVEGSSIYFTSFADDAISCEWYFERDGLILFYDDIMDDLQGYFEGLTICGIKDNYLVLGNIPLSMDGWNVICRFTGSGEAIVDSDPALINVKERTLKIHGEERKTVKGTGNVSGCGAVIDFEGEDWWVVEEYAGRTFCLMPRHTDSSLGISKVELSFEEDGSVLLIIDDTEYRGTVAEERIGGYTASAEVVNEETGAVLTIWFDYTEYVQYRQSWDQIFMDVDLVLPDKDSETLVESEDNELETAPATTRVEFILDLKN